MLNLQKQAALKEILFEVLIYENIVWRGKEAAAVPVYKALRGIWCPASVCDNGCGYIRTAALFYMADGANAAGWLL